MIWEPKQCCCCTNKVGCYIFSVLGLISSSLIILMVVRHAISGDISDLVRESCKEDPIENCEETIKKIFVAVLIVQSIFAAVDLCVCSLLIHGVRKDHPGYMVPYMIKNLIGVGLGTIFSTVTAVFLAVFSIDVCIRFLAVAGFLIFLQAYFLLCVRAHYLEVKRASGESHVVLVENESTHDDIYSPSK